EREIGAGDAAVRGKRVDPRCIRRAFGIGRRRRPLEAALLDVPLPAQWQVRQEGADGVHVMVDVGIDNHADHSRRCMTTRSRSTVTSYVSATNGPGMRP